MPALTGSSPRHRRPILSIRFIRLRRATLLPAMALLAALLVLPVPASAQETFVVNATGDAGDASPGNGTCETATAGECTLRAAIEEANAGPQADTIAFDISPAGPHTIQPASALPTITDPVVIAGTTQPGFVDTPVIELDGQNAGTANGLTITAGDSTVRGLVINRFGGHGISIFTAGGNLVEGNFIGTNAAGDAALGNDGQGVDIAGVPDNTIGGTAPGAGNVVSGNDADGARIIGPGATGNVLQGNRIGTNAAGTGALANGGNGVLIVGVPTNVVGGTDPGAGNVISGNNADGVLIQGPGATGNIIQGNRIGTNAAGDAALPNGVVVAGGGVRIISAPDNTIGGTAAGAGNVISGNLGNGVLIQGDADGNDADGNVVQGNLIGTNAAGDAVLGNGGSGVRIGSAPNNTIGGTDPEAGNVISGNSFSGVRISDPAATGNVVQGNLIGTNADGTAALGNDSEGVAIFDAPSNTVGGTDSGAGNVISGNSFDGVRILGAGATGNVLEGNRIGTNAAGTTALGNAGEGVSISGAPDNTIGGTHPEAGNVISGNSFSGVNIFDPGATGNVLEGNRIGTNAAGDAALGNGGQGVVIDGVPNNTIGGTDPGWGNVISGNTLDGVLISNGATGNVLEGNLIGTNAAGDAAIGNGNWGVFIASSEGNTIGGTDPGAGNVISGNNSDGVLITGTGATGNVLEGNLIGTNAAGDAALANASNGVFISGVPDNTIGGTDPAAANTIAFNGGNGVLVTESSAVENPILGNSIFDNGALGIDLGLDGVTPNDSQDGDTGPNNLQNFPVLDSATADPENSTTVEGTLHSTPTTTFRLELFGSPDCDPSGNGEGRDFLGTEEVTTDGSGDAPFTAVLPQTLAAGEVVTATATDPAGNTSEFSECVEVEGEEPPADEADLSVTKTDDPDPVAPEGALTYTVEVENLGPGGATGVLMTDRLPDEVAFDDATPSQGDCTFRAVRNQVRCALGTLPSGDTATVQIQVTAPAQEGTLENLTRVQADQDDPDPGNDTATEDTTVAAPAPTEADLVIAKTDDPDPVQVGEPLTYLLTVGNAGPADATGVQATDPLPPGMAFSSATPSQGTCSEAGGEVTCDLGAIASGQEATVQIEVSPEQAGIFVNTAEVSGDQDDPDPDNNTASETTAVEDGPGDGADLSITKTDDPDPVAPGGTLTYTIEVGNAGPEAATSVVMVDRLPEGVAFVSATASQGDCTFRAARNQVRCALGILGSGDTATVEIEVTAPADTGTIDNLARVQADQEDPDEDNNVATEETTVGS